MRTVALLPLLALPCLLHCGDGGVHVDGGLLPDGARAPCDRDPCACAERGPYDDSRASDGQFTNTTDATQRSALLQLNRYRTAAGLPALDAHASVERAALAHATFMARNPQSSCWPQVHNEIAANCEGFTGANNGARLRAAGYDWSLSSEVINWNDDPNAAIDAWAWTVYHRQPLLDWRHQHVGFARIRGPLGNTEAWHNVMVFASPAMRTAMPPQGPVVFPAPGQRNVPGAFRGDLESPSPPGPDGAPWPAGYTSGTVVSVHFASPSWTVQTRRLYRHAGNRCEEQSAMFVSRDNDANLRRGTPSNDVFLIATQPLASRTDHVVQFEGTVDGRPWARTWAFTTE